jgi:hypothetical protein
MEIRSREAGKTPDPHLSGACFAGLLQLGYSAADLACHPDVGSSSSYAIRGKIGNKFSAKS